MRPKVWARIGRSRAHGLHHLLRRPVVPLVATALVSLAVGRQVQRRIGARLRGRIGA